MNIITATFRGGSRFCTTRSVFQIDKGDVLRFVGLDLPEYYEVHFSNSKNALAKRVIASGDSVVIPWEFMKHGQKEVFAWVYLTPDADTGYTPYQVTIPLNLRSDITDAQPDPEQEDIIGQAIAALNDGVERAEGAADDAEEATRHYPRIVDGYWQVWDAENEEWSDTGVKAVGEDGAPGRDGIDGKDGAPGRDGIDGKDGADGQDGAPGVTYTPTVSADGEISWSNDGGLPNPQPRNIKGPKGDKLTYADLTAADKADLVQGPIADAQTAAVNAVNQTGTTQVGNVNTAGATQVQAVNTAGQTALTAIAQKSTEEQAAIQQKGEDTLASIPSDYTELSEDVDDLKSALKNTNKELQDYLQDGMYYENPELFINGGLNNTTGAYIFNQKYRIVFKDAKLSKNTTIKSIKDGYKVNIGYYTDGTATSLSQSVFSVQSTPFTIPDNTWYKIVVKKTSEDTSSVADIYEFDQAVTFVPYVDRKIADVEEVKENVNEVSQGTLFFDKSIFVNGALNYTTGAVVTGVSHKKRVVTKDVQHNEHEIRIEDVNEDYQIFLGYYSDATGTTVSASFASRQAGYIIPANSYFRFLIRLKDETGASAIADIDVFRKKVTVEPNFIQKINYDNLVVIRPEYEILEAPATLIQNGWSDICSIGENLWFFKPSTGETHSTANGKIMIYNRSDLTLVKTINHDFGHMNTVSYDAMYDRLIVGNLPGNTTYPCALYVFYAVTDWLEDGVETLNFNSVDKTIIDLRAGDWTSRSAVSATFGENNGAFRNIVYISLDYGKYIAKLLLGMGNNQYDYGTYSQAESGKFNGSFNVLQESITGLEIGHRSEWDNPKYDEVWQGCDFYKGRMLSCNGDKRLATASLWGFNYNGGIKRDIVKFDVYTSEGEEYTSDEQTQSLFPEGITYDKVSGYIYQGLRFAQNEPIMHLIRYRL